MLMAGCPLLKLKYGCFGDYEVQGNTEAAKMKQQFIWAGEGAKNHLVNLFTHIFMLLAQ